MTGKCKYKCKDNSYILPFSFAYFKSVCISLSNKQDLRKGRLCQYDKIELKCTK